MKPENVVEKLLAVYLVRTTKERVQAYRYYREQRGSYWTTEKLQQQHWERLYAQVSLEHTLAPKGGGTKVHQRRMITLREALCRELSIAEESVPLHNLLVFFKSNEVHAQLALRYPTANVIKDALPWRVILAYQNALAGQVLPGTGFKCMSAAGQGRYAATLAAADPGYIVWPRTCADACLMAAYSMLKCGCLYKQQCWDSSVLTPIQQGFRNKYPEIDFHFWAMYGSWSACPSCGSYYFNDKYFSTAVYQDQVTSSTPDLFSSYRRDAPSMPMKHELGQVGTSSRWWYLPGMFKPSLQCPRCTPPPADTSSMTFADRLRAKAAAKNAAEKYPKNAPIAKTSELYRVPRMYPAGSPPTREAWAAECITWPRYVNGAFALPRKGYPIEGESMLELTQAEKEALQIVVLVC
jgi:hypothetical protein